MYNDFIRRQPVRYVGYAYTIAAAAKPYSTEVILVNCLKVRNAYIICDAAHKFTLGLRGPRGSPLLGLVASCDSLLYQTLATIVIPGVLLKEFRKIMEVKVPQPKWAPLALNLAIIPFLIFPIDVVSNLVMNIFFRTIFGHSYTYTTYRKIHKPIANNS